MKYPCHHIKALVCTYRKQTERLEADYVGDAGYMLRAQFAGCHPVLEAFLMDHKEGAAYREAPLPFIEKSNPAYTWTHSQDGGYFIANMNSCFPNLFCKELVNFSL